MKTVILCGGKGTRLREETEYRPKPLVKIGERPILWHIMKIYSSFGHNHFILALGYKGDMIKEYFMSSSWIDNNFSLSLKDGHVDFLDSKNREDWTIDFIETGKESLTSLRLFKLKKCLEKEENFMLTYGDGVADVNIDNLIKFHKEKGKIVTITALHPRSKFGIIKADNDGIVEKFKEKPILTDFINGGFMVFNKRIFDYLDDKNSMIVDDILPRLAEMKEVAIFHHQGFWHCMDTYRDYEDLNKMWDQKQYPWKIWK